MDSQTGTAGPPVGNHRPDTSAASESASTFRVPEGYRLVENKPPRPPPKTRRGRSKVPFSRHEWALIAQYAPRFVYGRQAASAYGPGGQSNPNDVIPDPTFAWQVCRFLRGSSIHISLLHTLRSSDVYDDESGLLRVRWPRAKTEALQSPGLVPRAEFDGWVRPFLDFPKPATEQAYSHMFDRLSDFIEHETRHPRPDGSGAYDPGERIKINGLRFRHTAIVRWLEPPFRFPPTTVCKWARTTMRTLTLYWNQGDPELANRLKDEGLA
jgi:hypothetical protein